jgi:hypothetical protein
MTLPIYRVLPHPAGGRCYTKAKAWRWPSVRRRLQSYPTWPRAMDAAFERSDVETRRQIVIPADVFRWGFYQKEQ